MRSDSKGIIWHVRDYGRGFMDTRASIAVSLFLTSAMPGIAQTVTIADLQGAVVEVDLMQQERVKRDSQVRVRERHISGQIKIGPNETITTTLKNVNVRNEQARGGDPRATQFTLGQQRKTGLDDDVIWLFSDGKLTRLRAFGGGGAGGEKFIIAFEHGPNGIQCKFSMNLLIEEGKDAIQSRPRNRDTLVEILESKQVSSTCRVVDVAKR